MFRNVPGQIKPNCEGDRFPAGCDPSRPSGYDYRSFVNFRSQSGTNSSPDVIDQAIIRAKRFVVFSIKPGRWFNSDALKTFHDGPWIDGPVRSGKIKLWGEEGILSRIPTRLVVAYSPSVELTIRETKVSQLKSLISATAEVSIGPFTFRASNSSFEESTRKVTLSEPGRAYILAVDSEVFSK